MHPLSRVAAVLPGRLFVGLSARDGSVDSDVGMRSVASRCEHSCVWRQHWSAAGDRQVHADADRESGSASGVGCSQVLVWHDTVFDQADCGALWVMID